MSRRLVLVLVAITAVAFALRAWGLASQVPTNDDIGVVFSAANWVQHGQPDPTMPFHPRLRDVLVYVSTAIAGTGAVGLKGWSVLLGTLCVPLLFGLVWRISRNATAATLAATLLALDGVNIGYSRQAIQEVHVAFFALLGTLLVVHAIVSGPSRTWRWLLPAAGVAYGLGAASKFYVLPVIAVSIGWLLLGAWRRRAWDEAVLVTGALVAVPALVFLLTYVPWFGRGYSAGDWFVYQRALVDAMVTHTRETGFMLYSEPAAWFVQPFTGFADFVTSPDGVGHLSIETGNPLVWLAVLPAVGYSLIVKRRRTGHQMLQTYFWACYLPLALSARPIWVLSSVVVVPFAIAIVALVAADIARRFDARIVYAYAAAAVVTSLLLYPLTTGRALEVAYLQPVVDRMGFGAHGTTGMPR